MLVQKPRFLWLNRYASEPLTSPSLADPGSASRVVGGQVGKCHFHCEPLQTIREKSKRNTRDKDINIGGFVS